MTLRMRKKNWAMQKHLQITCQLKVCLLFENDFPESNWINTKAFCKLDDMKHITADHIINLK